MSNTIKIETTKRGLPAIWETGGGSTRTGSATIVAKPDGGKPRAVFVRTSGHLSGGPHALICVHKGYYLVHVRFGRGDRSATIQRIVSTSVKDIHGERFEATAEVEVVNTFSRGEWDRPLDAKLKAAVEAASLKASTYHCRRAVYIDTSKREPESAEARKRRETEMAKQDAHRAKLRAAKAAADAKAKAEAEAASRTAKATGLGARLEALQPRLATLRANNPNETYGALEIGECRFSFGWSRDLLYNEENVAEVERSVARWEEQAAEELRKQQARTEFQPRFEGFDQRVKALGLSLDFGKEEVTWSDRPSWEGFTYDDKGLASFEADLVCREEDVARAARQAAAAKAKAKAESEAAKLDLPKDVRIWKRVGSSTGCSKGWVIGPDGVDRASDCLQNDNPRRAQRYDEGFEVWRQILPGEVVLKWGKAFTAADHEFEVIHLPAEGLTEAQLERIAEIQLELEETWAGRRGLSSGKSSPHVGEGWGLCKLSTPLPNNEVVETSESDDYDVEEGSFDSMEDALRVLQAKFGKNR